jgi:hypothetical protein
MTYNINNLEDLCQRSLQNVRQLSEESPKQQKRDSEGSGGITSLLNMATIREALTRLDQEVVEIAPTIVDPLLRTARGRSSRSAEAARRIIDDEEQWKKIKLAMKGKSTMMLKQNLNELLKERMRDIKTPPAVTPSFKPAARRISTLGAEKWSPKLVHAPKRWSISEEKIRHSTIVSSLEKMRTFDAAMSA